MDRIISFYESLSAFELTIIILITLLIISVLTLYIAYRIIKAQLIKRIKLGRRIVTFAADKASEKTKDNAIVQGSSRMIRNVVGDETVDKVTGAIRSEEEIDINADIGELLEELGEESWWFWIFSFIYNRFSKKPSKDDKTTIKAEKEL